MFPPLEDPWESLEEPSFSLQDIKGFPYEIYSEQITKYEQQETWFTGSALNDQPDSPGEAVDLYPLRINPIPGTVFKHAHILFGEVEDDGRPLVRTKFVYSNDEEKEPASELENLLNDVWGESNGRAIQLENGILSQIYGGCIFKVSYVPWEWKQYGGFREYPVSIELVNPKDFVAVPYSSNPYRLLEAWVVKKIQLEEAKVWGYEGGDKTAWYVEHITPQKFDITINGKPAVFKTKDKDYKLSGKNDLGVVPIVYIPHIRVGTFLGMNAYDSLKGIVKEYNLRYGDYGDAVSTDAHTDTAIRNVQGTPQVRTIGDNREVIDLGASPNISGNEPEPDMFEIGSSSASIAMKNLIDVIYAQYRRDANIPAVADGEDEGSQRSGLTLAIRFWPLTSHAGIERVFWTPGLDVLVSYVLTILKVKGGATISDTHLKMRTKQIWAPYLPRDREIDVQEWVARSSGELGSVEHLLELTRDVDDIPEERSRMLAWMEDKLKLEKKYAPEPDPFGGGGGTPSKPKQGEQK